MSNKGYRSCSRWKVNERGKWDVEAQKEARRTMRDEWDVSVNAVVTAAAALRDDLRLGERGRAGGGVGEGRSARSSLGCNWIWSARSGRMYGPRSPRGASLSRLAPVISSALHRFLRSPYITSTCDRRHVATRSNMCEPAKWRPCSGLHQATCDRHNQSCRFKKIWSVKWDHVTPECRTSFSCLSKYGGSCKFRLHNPAPNHLKTHQS